MNKKHVRSLATFCLMAFATESAFSQTLAHRYSFTSDLSDSIAGANGTLISGSGGQSAFDGNGNFDLNPENAPSVDLISLPSGIITGLNTNNVTYELWFSRLDPTHDWSRLFDFGNPNGSANFTSQYLTAQDFFTYALQFETFAPGGNTEDVWRSHVFNPPDGEVYVTVTYNYTGGVVTMYATCASDNITGIVNDFGLNPGEYSWRSQSSYPCTIPESSLVDNNNMLGGSQYGDTPVNAAYDEFRIYKGVLTPLQIALHAAWGPNVTNQVSGPIQTGSLSLSIANSSLTVPDASQLDATATFSASGAIPEADNVNLTAVPPIVYTSSDTNIAIVTANGYVAAVGAGTATITASFSGQTAQTTVNVTGVNPAVLVHDYHFNDAPGSTAVIDSAGVANGVLHTSGNSIFTGSKLYLNTNTTANGSDYVSLPSGLLSTITNGTVTFEAWVTQASSPAPQDWTEVWDFGDSSGGAGQQGTDLDGLKLIAQEGYSKEALAWDSSPNGFMNSGDENYWHGKPLSQVPGENYIAVVYDWTLGKVFMYRNGVPYLSDVGTVDPTVLALANNWLGQAQSATINNGNQPVPNFSGQYNEFRVWDGALTAPQIAAHYIQGPNGNLQPTLNISVSGANATISWLAAGATGYNLYSEVALGSSIWPGNFTAVSGVQLNNGTNSVTVSITGISKFFVLHNP
jgi:hypothetical protein